jgi:hypothetical protein
MASRCSVINAERAAFHAPDFVLKFRNARKIQLRNIVEECQSEKEGYTSPRPLSSTLLLVT